MNRKYILLISILLISALMLTACPASSPAPAESGGEAAAPAEEAPAAEAAATEAPAEEAAAGGPVTISYLGGAPGFQTDVIKQLVDQWNSENSDIQVEFINGPSSATDRYGLYLQTFQAQSSDIDVMEIDVIWPGDLAEHLLDLNQYGAADMMGDYFPAIVENNTVDGALVGAPWYTDGGLLYYRHGSSGEVRLRCA
ncbi:MAG: extracellular solute-binding protein [Caldilineaceae bacterium]